MAEVKLRVTYNAAKLVRSLPDIIEKLTSDMADKAEIFYKKNTEKGKDIYGNSFKALSKETLNMRKKGLGTYKTPISHDKPLIASRKMIRGIKRVFNIEGGMAHGLEIRGYGVHHVKGKGKLPKREWFGVSKNVIKNIIDNKKLKLFRRQISKAFKK